MSTEATDDDSAAQMRRDIAILRAHSGQLSEQFDTVEIIATRHYGKGTIIASDGIGNWYARYGSVKAWVKTNEQQHFAPDE